MPTKRDLRRALTAVADRAPTRYELPATLSTPTRSHRRASRILVPSLAAAAVIAITVAVSLVVTETTSASSVRGSLPAVPTGTPAFAAPTVLPTTQYIFDIAPIDGHTIADGGASPTERWLNLTGSSADAASSAAVAIYLAGGFHPPGPADAVAVTINGARGFLRVRRRSRGVAGDEHLCRL
jgi:hypothetical protein